jgi:hypothetical protein
MSNVSENNGNKNKTYGPTGNPEGVTKAWGGHYRRDIPGIVEDHCEPELSEEEFET